VQRGEPSDIHAQRVSALPIFDTASADLLSKSLS
jgi:hypothetical protein